MLHAALVLLLPPTLEQWVGLCHAVAVSALYVVIFAFPFDPIDVFNPAGRRDICLRENTL